MAALVKTRPTFRSCSISLPFRVSALGRPPRSEWSRSSSPPSLRPWRCARCSPSSRSKPGDEFSKPGGGPSPVPDLESAVVGGGLAGGVRLLLSGALDVAGGFQDGTAGGQLAADHPFRSDAGGIPAGAVWRLPAVLHQLGNRQPRLDVSGSGPRAARRLRVGHQAGQADSRRALLLHLNTLPALRRQPGAALPAGTRPAAPGQRLRPGPHLHHDQPAARGLAAALVPPRDSTRAV